LYFDDSSRNKTLTPLADGITESLIHALQATRGIDIVSAAGAAAFRESKLPDDSLGRLLAAGSLVRGFVRDRDGRYEVAVRLIDGVNGRVVSANTFQVPTTGLHHLRDTVVAEVGRFLRSRLGRHIALVARRRETTSDQAWLIHHRAERLLTTAEESSWRGRWDSTFDANLLLSDSLLAAAQALDNRWSSPALARGRIAFLRAWREGSVPKFNEWADSGLRYTKHAMSLDSSDADALAIHGALLFVKWRRNRDINLGQDSSLVREARAALERAIEIDANNAEAWFWRSQLYRTLQDFANAALAAERAYAADAYLRAAPRLIYQLWSGYYNTQAWVESWRWCGIGARRFPEDPNFLTCQLSLMAARPGADPDSAWRVYDRLRLITPVQSWPWASRNAAILAAGALAQAGLKDSARRVLVRSRSGIEIDRTRYFVGQEAMIRETALGDRDEALRLLAEFLVANPGHRAGLASSPSWWWTDMRRDPRFRALVGLP
jgi:TolB-like protein/tetratricopeptide (TPR) repeat protein